MISARRVPARHLKPLALSPLVPLRSAPWLVPPRPCRGLTATTKPNDLTQPRFTFALSRALQGAHCRSGIERGAGFAGAGRQLRAVVKAGGSPIAATDLHVASCETAGVADPPVLVTLGPKSRFPSAACTSHRMRRHGSAAPLSHGERSLGHAG